MGQGYAKGTDEWPGSVKERVHELSRTPTRAWRTLEKEMVVKKVTPMDPSSPRREGWARFVCISDTHTQTGNMEVPDGDVLLHAGDFSQVGELSDIEGFAAFLDTLPHRHKIVIAGNHDLSFDEENFSSLKERFQFDGSWDGVTPKSVKTLLGRHCTYLQDEETEVMGIRVYGSPWQPEFGNWAFNLKRGVECLTMWDKIPAGIDVLITHGPPLGHGDRCYDGQRAGCLDLLQTIQKRVRPKYHVFGHIHEGYGVTTDGKTTYINAASCNLSYRPIHPPVVFELPLPESQH